MRAVDLSHATGSLSDYARKARRGALILTRRGKAVAAMVPLGDEDYFSMRLANNPEFIAIIERGRAQYKPKGGLSLDEMRHKYGLDSKTKRKALRKVE
jgi:antitoxin (DNA-binding transcriptional repressor) of toxin-antitoxin stability system